MARIFKNISFLRTTVLNTFNFNKQICLNKNVRLICTTMGRMMENKNAEEGQVTIQEVHARIANLMGVEKGYRLIPKSREHLFDSLPKNQNELEPRSMQDSFTTAIIPLATDLDLQDKYVSFLGHVRSGRLLEDMDIFAVWVVYHHIKNPRQNKEEKVPYTFVTVLVDKIEFSDLKRKPNQDIRLSGHVSWVGTSSIEVVVWVEQKHYDRWEKITRALFVMAARDPMNRGPAPINPIKPANEEEQKIYSGGLERKKRRLQIKNKSIRKVMPTEIEQNIVHDIFIRTMPIDGVTLSKRILPTNCIWMENCTLANIIFSHPENRNLHNKVFGGFIMRQATEISWALAFLFSKYRPSLRHISDINFHKPIAVNSLIRMTGHVVYTEKQYVQISVYAETFDGKSGVLTTTNEFHFTYLIPEIVPEVLPKTYQEAMMYLDGRRHLMDVLNENNQVQETSFCSKL